MDIQATPADIERLLSQSDWLCALARKLVGDASTADDLVQDTWIAALQNPPDPDRPVRPWLAGILRRVASMRARAEGRRSWRQRRAARKDELPSAASLVGEVDLQQRLSREVLELAEPYRTTLLLRYFHDLPAVEIARRQGIPAGTVRWRLKRGLDELRIRLDRSFGDRRSWCLALVELARRQPAAQAGATGAAGTVAAAAAILAFLGLGIWALVDRGRSDQTPDLPRLTEVRPLVERATPGAPELAGESRRPGTASEGMLSLRLVEPRGFATAGLPAVALHADGTVTEVRSDAGGIVRFAGSLAGGQGEIWVDRPGSFIAPAPFTHASGTQDVRLPDGVEFARRAEHAGEAVPEGFLLELDSDVMMPWGPLPASIAETLGVGRRARATTDGQGRFRFHSLPPDFTGVLWLPPGWRLAEYAPGARDKPKHDRRRVSVADPDLALEVMRMPEVRGRVLDRAGAPAAGARVQLRMQWIEGERRASTAEVTTGEDGAFAVELDRADLESLVVSIAHEDLRARTTHRRRRTAPPLELLDLGVTMLSDAPPDELAVRGPAGPLTGAWLHASGRLYGPSGEDGRIEPPAAAGRGWIGAGVPLDERRVGPERAAGGCPRARDEDPPTDPRRGGCPAPRRLRRTAHGARPSVVPFRLLKLTAPGSKIVDGRPAARSDGWIELVDLPAGEVLELGLLDVLGRPLDTVTLQPLTAGERREVEHVLQDVPLRLVGRCLEESGGVLLGVLLDFEAQGERPLRVRSDPEGRFALEGLASETLVATVRKRGFLSRRITFGPAELRRPQEIRLARSCDLVVHAVDMEGRPHERIELAARHGEIEWVATETAPGEYTLLDLPLEPVQLEWSRGEFSGSVAWDPSTGSADLAVGPGGTTIRAR